MGTKRSNAGKVISQIGGLRVRQTETVGQVGNKTVTKSTTIGIYTGKKMIETGFKNKYEKEDKLNDEAVHVINLYPKNPAKVEYHTIVLYVSKSSNELKKAVMKAKDGTIMSYTLSKFQSNPPIDDTKFVFDMKKYPGYALIKD